MSVLGKMTDEGWSALRSFWWPTEAHKYDTDLGKLRITLRGGRHTGAIAEIDRQEFTIGSDLDSNIVLTDPEIEARHLVIRRVAGGRANRVAIDAIGSEVMVSAEILASGDTRYIQLPTEVAIGGTRIQIEATKLPSTDYFVPGAIAVGVIAGLALIASALNTPKLVSNALPNITEMSIPGLGGLGAKGVESKIARSPLKGKIQIASRGDVIVARGTLVPDDYKQWRTLREELVKDGLRVNKFINLVGIANNSTFATSQIAAVSMLPEPTVIGLDGRRARKGEVLAGGWKVLDIENDKVVMKRGTQTVVVPY